MEEIFKKYMLPTLVRNLIIAGMLDTNKLSDKEYIWSVIREHPEFVNNFGISIRIEDSFLQSARDAIALDRPEVAIVLLATFIEHKLNIFYRDTYFESKSDLDNNEITNIIRRNNIYQKTGSLFSNVLQRKMDSDLQKSIRRVADLRNQVVHYKVEPSESLDDENTGSHNKILKELENLDFDEIFETIERLSDVLENEMLDLRLSRDDYKYTQEALKSMFRDLE